jgi:hypothetical protein
MVEERRATATGACGDLVCGSRDKSFFPEQLDGSLEKLASVIVRFAGFGTHGLGLDSSLNWTQV